MHSKDSNYWQGTKQKWLFQIWILKQGSNTFFSQLSTHEAESDSCNTVDCTLPGSPIHGISQARILDCVASSFFRGSSQAKDPTCVSCIGRQILYHWATREVLLFSKRPQNMLTFKRHRISCGNYSALSLQHESSHGQHM